jgi:uracil-DNA glycosylase family 4
VAKRKDSLVILQQEIVACTRCPRLIEHSTTMARVKRRAYLAWDYWGKPVPPFGDARARLLIIGLAPAAHGGNRTGRMFTGDRSGDFLFRALYETGFASQPESQRRDDGLVLADAYITGAAHCAPPDNKPTPDEFHNCREYLERELDLLPGVQVIVALGKIAFDAYLTILKARGVIVSRAAYAFGHGVEYRVAGITLLGCYHPSQQNTSTGKLTAAMLRDVFERARTLLK